MKALYGTLFALSTCLVLAAMSCEAPDEETNDETANLTSIKDQDEDTSEKSGGDKDCFNDCLKKGLDEAECKKACFDDKDDIGKSCFNDCLKKGLDEAECKKACFDDKDDTGKSAQYDCKKYQNDDMWCVECWDENGTVVKKFCK